VGSSIIFWWGYKGIFLVSALGRIFAALFFLRVMRGLEQRQRAAAMLETSQSVE
jgi:hypothetical protein